MVMKVKTSVAISEEVLAAIDEIAAGPGNRSRVIERALVEFPTYCDAAYNLARIHTEIQPDVERVIEVLEPVAGPCAADVEIQRLLERARHAVGRYGEKGESVFSSRAADPSRSPP